MAPSYSQLVELLIDGARFGDAEDVVSALDQGASINAQDEQGRTGATTGMRYKSDLELDKLRAGPPCPSANTAAALHMAAANGHCDLLRTLLDAGAVSRIPCFEPINRRLMECNRTFASRLSSDRSPPRPRHLRRSP